MFKTGQQSSSALPAAYSSDHKHLVTFHPSPSVRVPLVLQMASCLGQELWFCSLLTQHLVNSTWHNGVLVNDKTCEVL